MKRIRYQHCVSSQRTSVRGGMICVHTLGTFMHIFYSMSEEVGLGMWSHELRKFWNSDIEDSVKLGGRRWWFNAFHFDVISPAVYTRCFPPNPTNTHIRSLLSLMHCFAASLLCRLWHRSQYNILLCGNIEFKCNKTVVFCSLSTGAVCQLDWPIIIKYSFHLASYYEMRHSRCCHATAVIHSNEVKLLENFAFSVFYLVSPEDKIWSQIYRVLLSL